MEARDLMSFPVVTVKPDATVGEAARLMLDAGVSALPVVDEHGNLVGILTHADFGMHPRFRPIADNVFSLLGATTTPRHVEAVSLKVNSKRIRDVMRRRVFTVSPDTPLDKVTEIMLTRNIHRLPVIEDGQLVGIITRHDFLKLIAGE